MVMSAKLVEVIAKEIIEIGISQKLKRNPEWVSQKTENYMSNQRARL